MTTNLYDPGDGTPMALRVVNRDGSALSAGGGGGTSSTDDAAFTPGASSVTPAGGIVTSDTVDAGDAGAFAMLANRQQKITLYDSSGVEITSFGGGTQYTEDAAAAANPVGNALILVREDARGGSLTTTDGDNVAARGTNAGELYVKHVDAIPVTDNGGALTVDGTVAVTNSGLTELAAAINASSQMDVNIAASGATVPVSHAALTELAAAIDTEVQVDVVGALPAGTNNIGDVDVLSVIPGTGATNLGKAADAVAGATDTGVVPLAIRDDALSSLTPAEGDYAPLRVNSTGALYVTGGGGGTQYAIDDVASATATGTVSLVVRKDSAASLAGTDGDITGLQVDANGALRVTGGGGGTEYTVDAAAPAAPTGATFVMERDDALSALSEIEGDWTNPRASANGALWVSVDGSVAVTNAGLTELAAAINGSSQMDVNIAANGIGLATSAKQDTIIGHVDGIETVLGTIDADTGNIVTAVQLLDDTVTTLGTDTYTEATSKGLTIGAVRRDADTTLVNTTNEFGPLQMDANGRLKVEAFSGETLPVSLASVPSHAVTNAGTFAVQVDGNALTALQLIDNTILVDDAAFTPGTSSVNMAGFQADETATDSVNEGDAGAARMTLDRKLIVTPQPHTAGGLSIFRSIDLDETEEEVKGSAGCVYSITAFNRTAAPLYLKWYDNTAAGTTVGTTTPIATFVVPANADSDGAGFSWSSAYGVTCATGITVACTTGVADADTGAPGANDCVVVITYA